MKEIRWKANNFQRLKACDNIVRIYHSDIQTSPDGRKTGVIYMEYVHSRPLSQVLDVIPNASIRYHLVKQLTNAIRCVHQNSVIHRDINPSNILVTDTFELKWMTASWPCPHCINSIAAAANDITLQSRRMPLTN